MKKFLSLVLALVMTMSLVTIGAGAKDFTDNSKIKYNEAVDVMSAIKVIDGYTDGAFNPANTLTRGAAAKIICNLILGPTTASALGADTAPFKDVPASNNFSGYIAYCSQQGIINGYADGTFRPAGTVTGYQFMKMLLVALGYNGQSEGFTGANWSVNVAKLALSLGLNKGNDEFNGVKAMTREEACLYAFNTLKATMVEYDSTTNIVISGTPISVGGSKAKDVVNNNAKDYRQGNNTDKTVQFCERYFPKLTLTNAGEDDFARPANQWKNKAEIIGTYAKTPDVTYTKEVKTGDIYKDLGLGKTIAAVDAPIYADGVAGTAKAISRGGDDKFGGNGVLTEVYLDDSGDTNKVTICMINTYVAEVSSVKAATASKDRSIVLNNLGTVPTGFVNGFETEAFKADDIVLYTYSNKVDVKAIKSVALATTADGTLTARTMTKDFTLGTTAYKYSKMANFQADAIEMKSEVTTYLDAYGYSIYEEVTKEAESHYAYVLGTGTSGNTDYTSTKYVTLFMAADGKVVTVEADKNYASVKGGIVTYSVNSDKQYVLTNKTTAQDTTPNGNTPPAFNANVVITRGTAAMTLGTDGATTTVYANSKTLFLVRTGTADNYKYNVYTGIANVPSISGTAQQYSYYAKNTGMATVVFVDAVGATVTTSKNDVVYLITSSQSKEKTNADSVHYYTYDAVVNGKITTLDVKVGTDLTVSSKTVTGTDKKDAALSAVVFGGTNVSDGIVTSFVANDSYMQAATSGTYKTSDGSIGLGGAGYFTAAKDATVFLLNEDGKLVEYSVGSILKDSNDKALYYFKDGEISSMLIVNVKGE